MSFPVTGLVSYWPLDEASGDALDAHGGMDLTETGAGVAIGSIAGKVGTARDFETVGGAKYFQHADHADLSTGDIDFEFCGWAQFESRVGVRTLVSQWANATRGYILYYNSTSARFEWAVGNGTTTTRGTAVANNFGAASDGVWYFVDAWHDSVNNLVGIAINNGTPNTVATSGAAGDAAQVFRMGESATGGQLMDGPLDEWGFWKRLLTAAERTWLYNSGNGRSYAEVLAAGPRARTFFGTPAAGGAFFGGGL
jgi:hypothetical protein